MSKESEAEPKILRRLCKKTRHSLAIRCSRISDPSVLQAIVQANKRGVLVRILVDLLNPALKRTAFSGLQKFEVRTASVSDKGHFRFQHSGAFFDTGLAWFGVKEWSPHRWKGKSEIIIDSQHPNSCLEGSEFETLWKRGQSVARGTKLKVKRKE